MDPSDSPLSPPILEARGISKHFGGVSALVDASLSVSAGQVVCLLGDNGAGKSTMIKLLSGLWSPDSGQILVDGEPVSFASPRDALQRGIATVYQDLAVLPLMSIARNFVLGSEQMIGRRPFRRFDRRNAADLARSAMADIGIIVRDTNQLVGTLSGGERQTLAIARAEHFGARVLILDEPTSALGVREAATVLRHVIRARDRGLGVIVITHNVSHALPIGDQFVVLSHGRMTGTFAHSEVEETDLHQLMGGGDELRELRDELAHLAARRHA